MINMLTIRFANEYISIYLPFLQTEVNFGKDIADNSWHFVVFTVDAVDKHEVQFYLDGDPVNGNPW